MQPGELVVARLGKGATIVRVLEVADSQVRVALGRNKQARIPADRVALATGLFVSSEEEVEQVRKQAQEISSGIDLVDVWDVVTGDEPAPISVHEVAELYWGAPPEAAALAALVLHLDRSSDYFAYGTEGYTPLSRSALEEIRARRRREAENAEAAATLMQGLSDGNLPAEISRAQTTLLDHLRGYTLYGEDYSKSSAAKALLETLAGGKRDLQRLCFELLAKVGVYSPDEPLEMHRAGVRMCFAGDALAEAQTIDLSAVLESPARRDLTSLPTLTIDDAESEDRDDALSMIEESGAGATDSDIHVGIHIADAGSLIPSGGPIDREADQRMATIYLPEFKISMLPPEVVSSAGSLDPGEARPSLSVLARISDSGDVLDWEVTPSVVRSQTALSYEGADYAMKDETSPWHRTLARLDRAASALRSKRESAGAVTFSRAELAVKVRDSGSIDVSVRRSTPAGELVAEFMILCNSLLASFCRAEDIPAAYRSQKAPDLSGLLADSSSEADSARDARLVQYLVMRRLPPSDLDLVPAPHASLGVKAYIQATSPLRRYSDLLMQRQISYFLGAGGPLYTSERVASVAQRAEVQLREIAQIEEQRKRYWFLKYLQQSRLTESPETAAGELFPAVVLENDERRHALLELVEYPFRVRAEVPSRHVPGETVMLRLHSVDLWRRIGYFVYVDAVSDR